MSAVLWEPDFDVYLTRLEESHVSVVLDLNAASHAPVETHPYLLRVRIVMQAPNEHGLRSPDEFAALNALEDALTESLGAIVDGLHVGHTMLRGLIDVVFYCPTAVLGQSSEIDLALEGVRGAYKVEPILREDHEWNFYREIMFPDPYDLQFLLNRRLLDVISRKGDDLAAKRQVDHLVLFPEEEQARAALGELTKAGFAVEARSVEESEVGESSWPLSFHRAETLEGRTMDQTVAQILDVILPLGGDYDGWECPIVPKTTS